MTIAAFIYLTFFTGQFPLFPFWYLSIDTASSLERSKIWPQTNADRLLNLLRH
jgi:hypothetical protein